MSVQVIIKLMGMGVSILLVRIMAKEDYAFFTIAISILHTIVMLSDSGIGSGVMAIGGRHWENKSRMGQLVNSALALRNRQFYMAAIFAIPLMVWLLIKNEASIYIVSTLVFAVVVGSLFEIRTVVYTAILRLNNQFDSVQRIDIINTIVRLSIILILALLFLDAFVAVMVFSVAYGVNYFVSKNWVAKYIEEIDTEDKEDKQEINTIIKHQLPNAVYYSITGQIAVFLISIFGSTEAVADVGVLTRLAIMFSIINVTLATVVMPKFSKSNIPAEIKKGFMLLVGLLLLIAVVMISLSYFFPDFFLFIFGKKYSHLTTELVWLVGGAMMSLVTGVIFKINASRGWVIKWWLFIPVGLITQIVCLFFLDISTVIGVIQYNIILNIPALIMFVYLFYYKVGQMEPPVKMNKTVATQAS